MKSSSPQRGPLAHLSMGPYVGMADSAPRDENEAATLYTPDTPPDPYKDFDKINSQPASSWPSSSFQDPSPIPTTTLEAVLAQARAREEEEDDGWKKFFDENPDTPVQGVADATPEPGVMSFFAGQSHEDGRRAYNQHLISQGKAPLPEGRR